MCTKQTSTVSFPEHCSLVYNIRNCFSLLYVHLSPLNRQLTVSLSEGEMKLIRSNETHVFTFAPVRQISHKDATLCKKGGTSIQPLDTDLEVKHITSLKMQLSRHFHFQWN